MAEFCAQCAVEIFGEDSGDLMGLLSPDEAAKGLCVSVLCEGCGPTRVDIDGNCLEYDCLRHGHSVGHKAWIELKTGRKEHGN